MCETLIHVDDDMGAHGRGVDVEKDRLEGRVDENGVPMVIKPVPARIPSKRTKVCLVVFLVIIDGN